MCCTFLTLDASAVCGMIALCVSPTAYHRSALFGTRSIDREEAVSDDDVGDGFKGLICLVFVLLGWWVRTQLMILHGVKMSSECEN